MAPVGIADRQPRELHQAGDAGEQAAQHVDRQLHARDGDAAQARRLLVRADGEHVAPEARVQQQRAHGGGEQEQQPHAGREHHPLTRRSTCGRRASSSLSHDLGASIFWSRATPLATPRTSSIVPSVTMNGTTLSRVTRKPLSAPQPTPAAMPASAAAAGGAPARRQAAMTTVASAMIAPDGQVDAARHDHDGHAQRGERDDGGLAEDGLEVAEVREADAARGAQQHREQDDDRHQAAGGAQVLAPHRRGPQALRQAAAARTPARASALTRPPRCPAPPRAPAPARSTRRPGAPGPGARGT